MKEDDITPVRHLSENAEGGMYSSAYQGSALSSYRRSISDTVRSLKPSSNLFERLFTFVKSVIVERIKAVEAAIDHAKQAAIQATDETMEKKG